jgi:hypothetical protein
MSWPTTILVRLTVLVASLVAVLGVTLTNTSPVVTSSPAKTHPASYLSGGWGGRFALE